MNEIYHEASLTGVIRIILWILVISFLIRLIARMALPIVVKNAEQNMRKKAEEYYRKNQPTRREGDVTIENQDKNKTDKNSEGDYVDYVEIKD